MRLKSIRKVEPVPSRCIEVAGDRKLFAVGRPGQQIMSHNSVVQRNIINACIMRPEHWRFLGIDLKRVELSTFRAYSNVVLGIATELEQAITVLRFAQQTMMTRYTDLEQLGYNNFLDLPDAGPALLTMVDEATELLSTSGVKALAGSTLVKYADGTLRTLESLQVGDLIEDSEGKPTRVTRKYAPAKEQCYTLKVRSDTTGETQELISGYQHYWVFYNESPTGEVSGSDITVTEDIYQFIKSQQKLPTDEQTAVKFHRSGKNGLQGVEGDEWFTLVDIDEVETDETIYCISVDSPAEQFLVTEAEIPTHNTDEGKAQDDLKGEAAVIIGSIARLGRAAGVHLVIATQRPDATVISGETKQNLGVRIQCGKSKNATASNMVLESGEGLRVKANPPGRVYLDLNGNGNHGQGFFADSDWIEKWLSDRGMNQDGTPKTEKRSRLAHMVDMNEFENADLDSREGKDNASIIESIRREEANISEEDDSFEIEVPADDSASAASDETPAAADAQEKKPGDMERPDLTMDAKTDFGRAEDDWDDELEGLIEENS